MLRSLIAVVAAVLVGLTTAKFIEGAGQAGLGLDPAAPATTSYHLLLLGGWGIGAFAAAATAILLGKRWAPLGWLGAASVFLEAGITLLTFKLSWFLWPASTVVVLAGGFLASRLLRAETSHPTPSGEKGLFSG